MRRCLAGAAGVRGLCAAAAVIVVTASVATGLTMVRTTAEVVSAASAPEPAVEIEPVATPAPTATPTSVPEAEAVEAEAEVVEAVTFDGRPLRKVETMTMRVTAYSPHAESCGKWADGITASGMSVWTNGMRLVAADTRLLPFGSIVSVPGYHDGEPVQVLDRGGAIKGKRLDVLYPTHERALQWGVQELEVTVWEYAD